MREEKSAVKIFLTKKEIEALRITAELYKVLSNHENINEDISFLMSVKDYADLSDELIAITQSAEQRVYFSNTINFIEEKI